MQYSLCPWVHPLPFFAISISPLSLSLALSASLSLFSFRSLSCPLLQRLFNCNFSMSFLLSLSLPMSSFNLCCMQHKGPSEARVIEFKAPCSRCTCNWAPEHAITHPSTVVHRENKNIDLWVTASDWCNVIVPSFSPCDCHCFHWVLAEWTELARDALQPGRKSSGTRKKEEERRNREVTSWAS